MPPLVFPMYFYIDNNNQYNRYRDAFKRRLAGFEDDEFFGVLTDDNLIDAQKLFRENRDLSCCYHCRDMFSTL